MSVEFILIGSLVLVSLWLLWKTRRFIWFCLLFFGALAALVTLQVKLDEISDHSPEIGLILLFGGAAYSAYKFAKKRS